MAKVKRGSAVKKGLKFFIYGAEGTWKSSFCLDFMRMKSEDGRPLRVIYIDCETGSIDNYLEDLEREGIDLNNLLIIYTTSYTEVEEWVQKAINEEELYIENEDGELEQVFDAEGKPFVADVIVVDGLTVISDNVKFSAINVSEKRATLRLSDDATSKEREVAIASAGLEFKDHDKIKMKGKNLLRNMIVKTDKYVCVTAREKMKRVMQKDQDGKMQLVDVGIIPDTWDGAAYEFYTVLRHFENEDGEICAQVMRKDRTKTFMQNEIIKHPTPLLWQSVIDGNKGKKANVLKDSVEEDINKDENLWMNQSVLTEDSQKTSDKDPKTVEDYKNLIDQTIKGMKPNIKKAIRPKIAKAGLELDYNKIDDLDQIKEFYRIITE